ncbi:MAG: DUF1501 domain-containing protein [Planctomycetes bacterium]|nr:DUF1501 domain-containing protein [Planctomycetota bacterium]
MLNLWGNNTRKDCSGLNRRDFLTVGALAMTGLTLPGLLKLRQAAANTGQSTRDTSVVWLWLGGGPTHVETFDPKMTAPAEFRSMVGHVQTSVPGLHIGGLYPQMGRSAHKMAFIRSFAHGNSGHGGGTHYVMTGVDHPPADAGQAQIRPSIGSIASRVRGANSPATGLPTYVRLSGLYGDGPHWLGSAYAPFDTSGEARNNININLPLERMHDRRALLQRFDNVNRDIDRTGVMAGLDAFDRQAVSLLTGRAREAFDIEREDPRTRDRYTIGTAGLGANLLLARRLCQAGAGFVTLNYSNSSQGWDMHNDMLPQLRQACPPMDRAISVFLEDLEQCGMADKVLLVITGEFGRTPRINGSAGRDHWGPLCTLALAGGGLRMGQAVGESSERAELPRTAPIYPKDLMATIFHVLGIPQQLQYNDQTGRPTYLLPEGARPIAELV